MALEFARIERYNPPKAACLSPHIDIKNAEYLEASDIESIHEALTEHFKRSKDPIEPSGVRDQNLLESAMARPHTSFGKQMKYMTMPFDGYPSFVFYKKKEKVPEFINKYGALLSKLAKT